MLLFIIIVFFESYCLSTPISTKVVQFIKFLASTIQFIIIGKIYLLGFSPNTFPHASLIFISVFLFLDVFLLAHQ